MSHIPDPEALRFRAGVLAALRGWMAAHGYLEVPTPVLVPSPAMEPTLYALPAADGYLRTSPEFALKRVVAAGLPRIYEIGPCFRADEHGDWHGREFTMLEWYRAGASLHDLMEEVQDLCAHVAEAMHVPAPRSWQRRTTREIYQELLGIDLATASASELSPVDPDDWDGAFFRRWVADIEPRLTEPTFVTEWPASQAALARIRRHRHWPVACRFEVFLGGVELANAFLELTDATEQRERFHTSIRERAADAPHPVDDDFIEAVGRMPPTSGIALGVDRLVAVLAGHHDIHRSRVRTSLMP